MGGTPPGNMGLRALAYVWKTAAGAISRIMLNRDRWCTEAVRQRSGLPMILIKDVG